MENKIIKIGDEDFELNLPNELRLDFNLPGNISINEYMEEWIKNINEWKKREKLKLRVKKINEINAKHK